jgi:hypothetical protein
MTHTQWHAAITADSIDTLLPEDTERLRQTIPGSTSHDASTGRLDLAWRLEAATLTHATDTALKAVRAALRDILGTSPRLVDVRVREAADVDAEATQLELWGYKETAEFLNVSRQRVAQLEQENPAFPRPIARLASGPVFIADSVRHFGKNWERRTGRPRKNTA